MAAALGQGLFMKMCFMEHRRRRAAGWSNQREGGRDGKREGKRRRGGSFRPSLALMRDDTFLSSTDSHPPICTWSPTSCLPSLAASGARFVFAVAPVSRAKEHWEPNEECWENKYLMQRKLEWSATEGARTPLNLAAHISPGFNPQPEPRF